MKYNCADRKEFWEFGDYGILPELLVIFSNSAVASSSLIHNLGPGNRDLPCASGVTPLQGGCESPLPYVTLYRKRGQGLQLVPSDQSLPGVSGSLGLPVPLPCNTFG